jgi:NAD(P)-dependent dehydrogenase (short-subunit alcohol dehydrogenase family)
MSARQTIPTLHSKVVVITGGTRGLGLATGAAMRHARARVIVSSRSSPRLWKEPLLAWLTAVGP